MPRCASSTPPPSRWNRQIFGAPRRARRCGGLRAAPLRPGGSGLRRSARLRPHRARCAARRCAAARPRATVSTSGSSGIRAGGTCSPGGASRPACALMCAVHGAGRRHRRRDRFRLSPRRRSRRRRHLVRRVFDAVAPRYDLMNDLMSGGIHRLVEGAAHRPAQSAARASAARCRRRHRRHRAALSRRAGRARAARSSATSTRRWCAPAATAPSIAAASTASNGSSATPRACRSRA